MVAALKLGMYIVKFVFSKKATKLEKIFTDDLTLTTKVVPEGWAVTAQPSGTTLLTTT